MEIVELLIEIIVYAAINQSVSKEERLSKLDAKVRNGLDISEKNLYLFLIVLMYLFIENDGKFTNKEKKLIKNELKNRKDSIKIKDYQLYKSIIYKKIDLDKVIIEIKRCEYDQLTVSRVLRDIKILFMEEETYRRAITKLETALYNIV